MATVDLFSRDPMTVLAANQDQFTPDFVGYLPANLHVYAAFEDEALKVARCGFAHYSARTIVEVLRHHSMVAESAAANGGSWKLNNNNTPFLARLFCLVNPNHASLFERRAAKSINKNNGFAA